MSFALYCRARFYQLSIVAAEGLGPGVDIAIETEGGAEVVDTEVVTAGATDRLLGLGVGPGIDTAVESKTVDTETVIGGATEEPGLELESGPGIDTAVKRAETVVVAVGVVNTD